MRPLLVPLLPLPEPERVRRLAGAGLGPDLLPLDLTPAERQANVEPLPPSPTGTPLVPATGLFLKLAAAVVAVAGVVLVSDFFPATHLDETIAGIIVSIGSAIGIASPGIRK